MAAATSESGSKTLERPDGYYEGMFLLDSAKFAADPDGLTRQVLGILEKAGGTIVAHRPWLDGKLAYEIERHRKGLHYVVLFRMPGKGLTDVTRACKLSEAVLRHMVISHSKVLFDANVEAVTHGNRDLGSAMDEEPAARIPDTDEEAETDED